MPGRASLRASVAMCTWNGERYLPAQLASILRQDHLPDEVVISDDGSTDGTIEILHRFRDRAPMPVHLLRNRTRLGVTANFEQAIGACSGDVLVLCDQDDVWHPSRVSATLAAFTAAPSAVLAFSDAWLIDAEGRRLRPRLWDVIDFGPSQRSRLRRDAFGFVVGRPAVTGCTLAVRASALDVLFPFPAEEQHRGVPVLHDWWISLALAAAAGAGRIAILDEPLVSYRLHPAQRIGLPDLRLRLLLPRWAQRLGGARISLDEQRRRLAAVGEILQDLERRLDASSGANVRVAAEHLSTRAELGGRRLGRIAPISKELRAGRYHDFGRGVPSALADLLRVAG